MLGSFGKVGLEPDRRAGFSDLLVESMVDIYRASQRIILSKKAVKIRDPSGLKDAD